MSSVQTFKNAALFGAAAIALASTAGAQVIRCEQFNYADGSLVPQGTWANHSGTAGDLLIASGQAVVQHGLPSEDANIGFTPVLGKIYFALDFSVDDMGTPITGTDNEYFAHFKDSAFGFGARFDIVSAQGTGDFTVGIASNDSTADALWATDLTFGTTYRAVASYDQDANIAELWINPTASTDLSIVGDDQADPGLSIIAFALRQSDSSVNETIRVDNLMIGMSFGDVLSTTATCGTQIPRFAAVPNPAVLSAGNAPHVGSTWNPVITSAGTTDILVVSFSPAIELVTPFGTLLCSLGNGIQVVGASGIAFALPIPSGPALVGLSICAQGAGIGAAIELTNALDIVIGG
jgi:hypothetical protein